MYQLVRTMDHVHYLYARMYQQRRRLEESNGIDRCTCHTAACSLSLVQRRMKSEASCGTQQPLFLDLLH